MIQRLFSTRDDSLDPCCTLTAVTCLGWAAAAFVSPPLHYRFKCREMIDVPIICTSTAHIQLVIIFKNFMSVLIVYLLRVDRKQTQCCVFSSNFVCSDFKNNSWCNIWDPGLKNYLNSKVKQPHCSKMSQTDVSLCLGFFFHHAKNVLFA